MKAGFAKVSITPPVGTRMMGFGSRDRKGGCRSIHDSIFVRAVYTEHEDEAALIMGFDLCFLGREEADRFKGAIGRRVDLSPRRILLNTSHSHAGPAVGPWLYGDFDGPDRLYLQELEDAVVRAATQARDNAVEATLWAGAVRSRVPMNRRLPTPEGMRLAPNPDGLVCDALPVCLFKDPGGRPIALVFSVSCHPSIVSGFEISAEFPGVAMERLDEYLGVEAALFLQGAGGDAKPRAMHIHEDRWGTGTWDMVEEAGRTLADEAREAVHAGLSEVRPRVVCRSVETAWRLRKPPERAELEAVAADPDAGWRRLWAQRLIERLDRGQSLATHAPITVQGIQLGRGLRIVAVEGELLAPHGLRIIEFFGKGVTFPLGYSNGTGLYLPTSGMLDEGGMEVRSYAEYTFPAPLAPGVEQTLEAALRKLRESGIE